MKHIVIAQPLAIIASLLDTLTADFKKDGFTITAYDSLPKDQADLGDRLADADLAVIANYPLQKEALAKAASLKYLCVAFTGVDHVDIDFCKEKGIAVSNCAGYSTESVAELTFALILALYRKLSEGGCAARNGKTSAGLMGIEIGHRKFGIIGTGAIGRRVADIANAFGADVYGYNRSKKAANVTYTDLDTLLSTCDIVSVHLPLTGETRGLLSREKLSLMKPGAILINTPAAASSTMPLSLTSSAKERSQAPALMFSTTNPRSPRTILSSLHQTPSSPRTSASSQKKPWPAVPSS